jgi:membrane protease YdiL (CAAX protease family)
VTDVRPNGRQRLRLILAWTAVSLTVAVIFFWSNSWLLTGRDEAVAGNTDEPSIGISFVARYMVGTREAFRKWLGGSVPNPPDWNLADRAVESNWDAIDEAILMAEMDKPITGADQLDRVMAHRPLTEPQRRLALDLAIAYRKNKPPAKALDNSDKKLLATQDWFGRLALSQGLPDADPARQALMNSAAKFVLCLAIGATLICTAWFFGSVLIMVAIFYLATKRVRLEYSPPHADGLYVEAFAIYLILYFAGGKLVLWFWNRMNLPQSTGLALIFLPLILIAFWWPRASGRDVWRELGWHRGRGIWREIGAGVLGYIGFVPLLMVCYLMSVAVALRVGHVHPHPVAQELVSAGPGKIALLMIVACGFAPIIEETFFRGALFNSLRSRWGFGVSALIVGLIFGAIHPTGLATIPILGGIGMALCALRQWRGSLIASMTAHALNNFIMLAAALCFR